jgi:hypothetical protein
MIGANYSFNSISFFHFVCRKRSAGHSYFIKNSISNCFEMEFSILKLLRLT